MDYLGARAAGDWGRHPITVAWRRANKDGVLGSVTHSTVRLVWHEMLRRRADVALIALGIVGVCGGGCRPGPVL